MKSIRDSKKLYWGLIITFFVLYFCVGFVSTLHSITFFELANSLWMAVLLGITYEVGQASVLFSILMTKNNQKFLPWALMFLLTALQVTANVYASFKFMDGSGSMDWQYWQRAILFWMETDSPEMFKVVISWITGALLPIVALGMTALVAENLKLKDEEEEAKEKGLLDGLQGGSSDENVHPTASDTITIPVGEVSEEEARKRLENLRKNYKEDTEIPEDSPPVFDQTAHLENLRDTVVQNTVKEQPDPKPIKKEHGFEVISEGKSYGPDIDDITPTEPFPLTTFPKSDGIANKEYVERVMEDNEFKESDFSTDPNTGIYPKKPTNNKRGWHLKKEFIDTNGDVYHFGQYQPDGKVQLPKKA